MKQTTIARRVECRGVGLHSGAPVEIAIVPAEADTGIVFLVPDSNDEGSPPPADTSSASPPQWIEIPARPECVIDTARATTLASGSNGQGGPRITTVEHLLASLFALEIDNARVEVYGPEIPVLDGAAADYCDQIGRAGREVLARERAECRVLESHEIREGDRWIRVEPAAGFQIEYAIDFPHPAIGRQVFEVTDFDAAFFEAELAPARTFGFTDEVEALRRAGLARGGDFSNTIVLDGTRVLNPSGLRWPDEFVRHKVIDLIGDLALLGTAFRGRIQVEKGGHELHHRLVRALAETPRLMTRGLEGALEAPPHAAPRTAYSA